MTEPKIDMTLPIAKNIKIIYGEDSNLNSAKEAEMAEAFLKFARPKAYGDEIRLMMLRQSLDNYYAVGESAVLAHYAKSAYHYLADKGSQLYSQFVNYIQRSSRYVAQE